jgi:hypothetical protein
MNFIILHREKIQEIGRTIEDFADENVFALAPAKLDTAELPALYSLTGSAQYNESARGETWEEVTRLYRIQVPVVPTGQATPELRESLCQPLIEKVVYTFNEYPTLNNCANVRANGVSVLSDSGIVVLPEWGAKYVGFEVRLQVIYDVPRVFAPGE